MGRHRLWALTLTLAVATGSAVAPPSTAGTAPPRDKRLASVRSFALAIGSGSLRGDLTRRYRGYDLVVLDGSEATAGQVAALRAHGRLVLGYLDVGTIERARPWSHAALAYRLGLWADWGEYYADVSRPALRRLMADQVAPTILAKGFDGLFLDNVDMVEGHPSQGVGMRLLVGAIEAPPCPWRSGPHGPRRSARTPTTRAGGTPPAPRSRGEWPVGRVPCPSSLTSA